MACIDERCQNPCRVANPCTGSQQCLVTDTLPTRTVACACPQGFVFGSNGECKQGKIQTHRHRTYYLALIIEYSTRIHTRYDFLLVEVRAECYQDTDCRVTEVCRQGDCMDACQQKQCGINAKCEHTVHDARCECLPGFTGDAFRECFPRKSLIFVSIVVFYVRLYFFVMYLCFVTHDMIYLHI